MMKGKNCKVVPVHATGAYRGNRGIASLILNLSNILNDIENGY
jgi:hypothetical protein